MNNEMFLVIPVFYLLVVSVPILVADFHQSRVPNKYTLPALYLWLLGSISYALLSGNWLWELVVPVIAGIALIIFGVYVNAKWSAIGMGDVKLFVVMGLSLSWKFAWVWLVLPLVSMVFAIATTLFLVVLTKDRREVVGGRLAPFIYLVYFGLVAVLFSI